MNHHYPLPEPDSLWCRKNNRYVRYYVMSCDGYTVYYRTPDTRHAGKRFELPIKVWMDLMEECSIDDVLEEIGGIGPPETDYYS